MAIKTDFQLVHPVRASSAPSYRWATLTTTALALLAVLAIVVISGNGTQTFPKDNNDDVRAFSLAAAAAAAAPAAAGKEAAAAAPAAPAGNAADAPTNLETGLDKVNHVGVIGIIITAMIIVGAVTLRRRQDRERMPTLGPLSTWA